MRSLQLGVVESEPVMLKDLLNILDELGYSYCRPATNFQEAIDLLDSERPDLLLLNIQVEGEKNGIEVARRINSFYKIPFIFLTSSSDTEIITLAKTLNPHAYIIQPFRKESLYAAIEIAFTNYTHQKFLSSRMEHTPWEPSDFIIVKDGHVFHKIYFDKIIFMKSEGNYVTIHAKSGLKVMIRSTLHDLLTQSPQSMFVRVHRGFSVNITQIEKVLPTEIVAQGFKIPIGKSYKKTLFHQLGLSD